jgi:multidrug efflux pump subunit AcrA (membrane-fusion protein)
LPFSDSYYSGKSKAYSDYYLPQLQQQFDEASAALRLQLSASGLGDSSAGAYGASRLAKEYADRQAEIAAKAGDYSSQARQSVQDMRNQLVSQLNATSDAGAATQAANSSAYAAMNRPNAFDPLGSAFTQLSNLYKNDTATANASGGTYGGINGLLGIGNNTRVSTPKSSSLISS